MKKGFTKIVFVIDRSGSMESVADDMIGGFNRYIKDQKEAKIGECKVSFYQFDDVYDVVYENVVIDNVSELTRKTYVPRNGTALLDAVAETINRVGQELENVSEEERPEKVMVVILTDGKENSSQLFSYDQVKEMIRHQTEKYSWEFVYIGANQNTWDVAQSLGIAGTNSISYVSTGKNTKMSNEMLWDTLSTKSLRYRTCASAKMDFSDEEREEQDSLIKNNTP